MVERNDRYIDANCASEGSSAMAGTSASGGRSARTWFTRAEMSASAPAASKFSLRRTLMVDRPCTLSEAMKSMPSAAAMARSSGVVMKPRTTSAFAPT
jgi:hypothetical protein